MWKQCVKSILNLRRFQCKKYAYLPTITIGLIKSCMSSKIACDAHAMLRLEHTTSWKRCCTLLIRYKLVFYICTSKNGELDTTHFVQIWFGDEIFVVTIPLSLVKSMQKTVNP